MSRKRKSTSSSASSGRSSGRSSKLFAAISELENADSQAAQTRLRATATVAARSLAARSQVDLSGTLIECRILMQRAVGGATAAAVSSDGDGDDGDGSGAISAAADGLLVELLEARRALCLGGGRGASKGGGEEEDDDDDGNDAGYANLVSSDDVTNLSRTLFDEYATLQSTWIDTFNRRHHDLRLHSGLTAKSDNRFLKVMDQNFWSQVEGTVEHERLMRQVHAPRGRGAQGARGGGKGGSGDGGGSGDDDDDDDDEPPSANNNGNAAAKKKAEADPILFDDSKVYQHLLRDFVSSSSSAGGSGGGGAHAAADAAATRLRRAAQKKKKKNAGGGDKEVDRRASKGRKIRYAVNPKLENFTFPTERDVRPAIEEDDWFRSLFGGAGGGGGRK